MEGKKVVEARYNNNGCGRIHAFQTFPPLRPTSGIRHLAYLFNSQTGRIFCMAVTKPCEILVQNGLCYPDNFCSFRSRASSVLSFFNRTCIEPERQLIFGPIGLPAAAARLNSDCCSLHVLLSKGYTGQVVNKILKQENWGSTCKLN